jgi:hypothetical protein
LAPEWRISHQLVHITQKSMILTGGLTPENVRDAILFVRPAGGNVHTGVEDDSGRKDAVTVQTFLAAVRAGFDLPGAGAGLVVQDPAQVSGVVHVRPFWGASSL